MFRGTSKHESARRELRADLTCFMAERKRNAETARQVPPWLAPLLKCRHASRHSRGPIGPQECRDGRLCCRGRVGNPSEEYRTDKSRTQRSTSIMPKLRASWIPIIRGKETTETRITTEHTDKKLINISVISVVIRTSVVKIVTRNPPRKT